MNDRLRSLAERVERVDWYHTIELPEGIVTPGRYDTRPILRRLPLPESLAGMRCLDVGTADGFWAFEMERRGGEEVVALEVAQAASWDWPAGVGPSYERLKRLNEAERGFSIAAGALGSRVCPLELSVYELSPERVGRFDYVFMGSLLLHLRDPVSALTAVRSVTRGELLSSDSICMWLSLVAPRTAAASLRAVNDPTWWTPNLIGHRRLLEAAGFEIVDGGGLFFIPSGRGYRLGHSMRDLLHVRKLVLGAGMKLLGAPSTWARARPRIS